MLNWALCERHRMQDYRRNRYSAVDEELGRCASRLARVARLSSLILSCIAT
jgi:hypothetical protein